MSKDVKIVAEMIDYVSQLRRHTEGRRSIHVKMSRLEKHFREEHYRRFAASALRPLITNFGATMFALPTTDIILIVKGAHIDSIESHLGPIRQKLRDSALIKKLDPIQGKSDSFIEWFDLEEDYSGFRKYIEGLGQSILHNASMPQTKDAEKKTSKRSPGMLEISSRPPERLKTARYIKMMPIDAPERVVEHRSFDPELVVQMVKAVGAADVGGMLRRQRVMAVLPNGQKQDVMIHKYVPREVVFEKLLDAPVAGENVWLDGYISELLASRVLFSTPSMENDDSIASSIHVTVRSIFDGSFDEFAQSLGRLSKRKVIIEFAAQDVLANFDLYRNASTKLSQDGFRVMIADIDLTAILWLHYESFDADFVKVRIPKNPVQEGLSEKRTSEIKMQIKKIGQARVILDGCSSSEDIALGMRLGITLFQGSAIEPYWI